MKTTVQLRNLKFAAPGLALFGLFALSTSAVAQLKNESAPVAHCSNRTLSGDYGCSIQGSLLNVPGCLPKRHSSA